LIENVTRLHHHQLMDVKWCIPELSIWLRRQKLQLVSDFIRRNLKITTMWEGTMSERE